MTTKTKIVLNISLTAFALSLTGMLWGIFLPIGAIFFGVFMNFYTLGKETALFDEEQRLRTSLAEKKSATVQRTSRVEHAQSLASARGLG